MASLDEIAQALALQAKMRESIAASDPYAEAAQVPLQVAGPLISGDYKPGEKIVGSLAAGLLGGILGGYSKDYQGRALQAYQDVASGKTSEMPAVLNPDLFAQAKTTGDIFKVSQANDIANRKAQLLAQLDPEIVAAEVDRAKQIAQAEAEFGVNGRGALGARPLTDQDRAILKENLGLTDEEAKSLKVAADAERIRALKQFQGERKSPPSPSERSLLSSNATFQDSVEELKKLIEPMSDNSVYRAVKGGKGVSWWADTESPEYKFYTKLGTLTQKAAKGELGSQISDRDVATWIPALQGLPALDSKKAIKERLESIQRDMKRSRLNMLQTMKKGLVNISGFESEIPLLKKALITQEEARRILKELGFKGYE